MEDRPAKMIIILRKDLNMRKGKMIAQGAHAAIAARDHADVMAESNDTYARPLYAWIKHGTPKIAVSVDSEQELLDVFNKARDAKMPSSIITDAGRTEFAGVPTKTAVAIGPYWSDEIDKITGELKLL